MAGRPGRPRDGGARGWSAGGMADPGLDRQLVLEREAEVALVVRRHAHPRAFAVPHQDVVTHPYRDFFICYWVRNMEAGRHALLLDLCEIGFPHRALLAFLDERFQF